MVTAIIPARGGSKGIPGKNVRTLCGKPLIAWTIEQAAAASQVDRVIVTTDSEIIGSTAEQYGAHYFSRSSATATDEAPSELAIQEVLESMPNPDLVVFLQCTSPIRQPTDIDNAIDTLTAMHADSVFSARRIDGYLWHSSVYGPVAGSCRREPRQLRQHEDWEENGSIYVFRPEVIRNYNSRVGGHIGMYLMHPLDSYQIDEPSDWDMLEMLMPLRLRNVG